ncbi:lipopolysaccharide transport periplasmic protein LptA [Bordetella genomosp. 8]|uniref:Lipopolysaccharide export system protein LptA n=1 Tax=Bordetella genomosp. 8 TaxID=1416806 RepID=A0A1W6YTH4_9BORD|nr:lipopolysaccharide transport periplasmic protein LptA [Bordetella genomosp. 8]ARP84311.1 lipopolysaccharide transport periplasmic protein LptA [Bordetella genomosp. 8]
MIELRKCLPSAWLTGAMLAVAGAVASAGAHAQATPAAPATPAASAPAGKTSGASGKGNAQTPAEEPNTVILSEQLHYDDVKKTSVFTGNVIMTRGLMTLHSDELQMREDAQGNQYGTALANPGKMVTVRQERPENFEVIEGVGRRAEYDGTKSIFDLIGQAVVTRYICGKPFDTIRGQKVRYNDKAGTYEAIGGPESAAPAGRVRSVMEPRARTDAAIAECRAQQGGKPAAGKGGTPSTPAATSGAGRNGPSSGNASSGKSAVKP